MDSFNHLKFLEESASDDDSTSSEERGWSDDDSVLAALELGSDKEEEDSKSVHGSFTGQSSPRPNCNVAAKSPSGIERAAGCINDGGAIQIVAGFDEANVGPPFPSAGTNEAEPTNLVSGSNLTPIGHVASQLDSLENDQSPTLPFMPSISPQLEHVSPTMFLTHKSIHLSNYSRRETSKVTGAKGKGRNQKSSKKSYDPTEWKEFFNPMASRGELEANHRKKKRARNQKDPSNSSICISNAAGGWDFGKKLGLTSSKSDTVMEKILRG